MLLVCEAEVDELAVGDNETEGEALTESLTLLEIDADCVALSVIEDVCVWLCEVDAEIETEAERESVSECVEDAVDDRVTEMDEDVVNVVLQECDKLVEVESVEDTEREKVFDWLVELVIVSESEALRDIVCDDVRDTDPVHDKDVVVLCVILCEGVSVSDGEALSDALAD